MISRHASLRSVQGRPTPTPTYPDENNEYDKNDKKRKRRLVSLTLSGLLLVSTMIALGKASPRLSLRSKRSFRPSLCEDDHVVCNNQVEFARGSLHTRSTAPSGQRLLEVPRHYQIWAIDALRDEFVRNELLKARIRGEGLLGGAFLAVYLARLVHGEGSLDHHPAGNYLRQKLPTLETYQSFHPVLWTEERVATSLGRHSNSYRYVKTFQILLDAEYEAFCQASLTFQSLVSHDQYLEARLWTLSRCFHVSYHEMPKEEELFYQKEAGMNFITQGIDVLVPILDMANHYADANAFYEFDEQTKAFRVHADKVSGIPTGQEIFYDYGMREDNLAFAKYGFIVGDGSQEIEAAVDIYHTFSLLKAAPLSEEPIQMNAYLRLGHPGQKCTQDLEFRTDVALEVLKLRALEAIARNQHHWVVHLAPLEDNSSRPTSTLLLKSRKVPGLPNAIVEGRNLHASGVLDTCRIISLSATDYNGQATTILEKHLTSLHPQNPIIHLPHENMTRSHQYRTMVCAEQLASLSLASFGHPLSEQRAISEQDTNAWMTSRLLLQEMQALEALREYAIDIMTSLASSCHSPQ